MRLLGARPHCLSESPIVFAAKAHAKLALLQRVVDLGALCVGSRRVDLELVRRLAAEAFLDAALLGLLHKQGVILAQGLRVGAVHQLDLRH